MIFMYSVINSEHFINNVFLSIICLLSHWYYYYIKLSRLLNKSDYEMKYENINKIYVNI